MPISDHLKAEDSIRYFAYQYADRQPAIFTEDYHNSLRAAFFVSEFQRAGAHIAEHAKLYSTFLVPYMIAFKSARKHKPNHQQITDLHKHWHDMPVHHRRDFADLKTFFRFGGLRSRLI